MTNRATEWLHLRSWKPSVSPSITLTLSFSLHLCLSSPFSLCSSLRSKEVPMCSSNSFREEQCNWRRYKGKFTMRSTLKWITVTHALVQHSILQYEVLSTTPMALSISTSKLFSSCIIFLSCLCMIYPTIVDLMFSAACLYLSKPCKNCYDANKVKAIVIQIPFKLNF